MASVELDYYNDKNWKENKGVLIYGNAMFLQHGQQEQGKALALLKEKYVQYQDWLGDSTVMVKFEPSEIVNWFD